MLFVLIRCTFHRLVEAFHDFIHVEKLSLDLVKPVLICNESSGLTLIALA